MRVEQITFTRFIAAILVVVFHYGKGVYPLDHVVFRHGYYGVSFFFVLSGFVMILAYWDKKPIVMFDYFKNRLARIYPIYLLSTLLTFAAVKFYNPYPVDEAAFTLNLFGLQAWVPGKAIMFNTPAWSLSVEVFFYLTFPIALNYVYARYRPKFYVSVFSVIWVATQYFVNSRFVNDIFDSADQTNDLSLYFPLFHLNQFIFGNVAGILYLEILAKRTAPRNYDWAILLMVLLTIVGVSWTTAWNLHDGAFCLVFVPLILLIALNRGTLTQIMKWKPLVFLGEISFGIYIFQSPIVLFSNDFLNRVSIHHVSLRFYAYLIILISYIICTFQEFIR
jgi:peptidoglycan/LPS O-acetylase OafA/YrhL